MKTIELFKPEGQMTGGKANLRNEVKPKPDQRSDGCKHLGIGQVRDVLGLGTAAARDHRIRQEIGGLDQDHEVGPGGL